MKLFGLEITKTKKQDSIKPATIQEFIVQPKIANVQKVSDAKAINVYKLNRISNPVVSFKQRTSTNSFEEAEYDLSEIGRMADVDSYIARAFEKKEGLMFKAGYELVGKNPETIQYIKERFKQIASVTGIPTKHLMKRLGSSLIRFSNTYVAKVRKLDSSGGKVRKLANGKEIDPVAGYFPMPPTTVRLMRNENNKILKYKQVLPNGLYKEFSSDAVLHFYLNKKEGFLTGTPSMVPVKDDVLALRKIEENVELLVYQHLFPMYHYKVGTEKAPAALYPDGQSEVDIVKAELEFMPAEGAIVTPERHEITALGAEGRALRVEGIINHFKQRVFAGCEMSSIDFGEGDTANRSTSDAMSRNLVDSVKAVQFEFEMFVNEFIINELLLESTFDDPLSNENIVELKFNEIDIDSKIKVENHAINMFRAYGITANEFRRSLGKEPFTEEDWEDTYWKRIEEPKMLIQAVDEAYLPTQAAIDNPNTSLTPEQLASARERSKEDPDKTTSKPKANQPKPTGGQRAAATLDQPENQHVKKSSPEKRKSSLTDNKESPLIKMYDDLLDNIQRSIQKEYYGKTWLENTCKTMGDFMKKRLNNECKLSFYKGIRQTGADALLRKTSVALSYVESKISKDINNFISNLTKMIFDTIDDSNKPNPLKLSTSFDSLRFLCRFIYDTELKRSLNYGLCFGLRELGHKQANVLISNENCDICGTQDTVIELDAVTIYDVPGYHSNCKCTIKMP